MTLPRTPAARQRIAGPPAPARVSKLRSALSTGVSLARRAYKKAVGDVLVGLVVVALASLPVLKDYDVIKARGWMWLWLVLFALKQTWDVYQQGRFAERSARRLAQVNTSLAGNIDTFAQMLINAGDRQLGEEECKRLVTGLLHRVKDYVKFALHTDDDVRLRVTLAVPQLDAQRRSWIRVWCYDEPYEDRRWTPLQLEPVNNRLLPGSPRAYVDGKYQIIPDIHKETGVPDLDERKFSSILSIPVKAGGPGGQTLAVLNVDATEANLFTAENVEQSIIPLVAAAVNVLALVLLTRRRGERYVFLS